MCAKIDTLRQLQVLETMRQLIDSGADVATAIGDIKEYLHRYESDIALGINDFGDLMVPFKVLCGKDPSPNF